MIVKKPYAFLIKKFRVIHTILFIMLLYLSVRSVDIYSFFNSYVDKKFYTNSMDLASTYIDFFMFAAAILTILLGMLIYYILSIKKKDRKLYIYLCVYYLVVFIFFIFAFGVFQNLQYKALEIENVRAIRDISIIILIPQLVFMFMILGRALGFNIKQFDFKKDLEELEVDTSDYEEVEITLGKNSYKVARTLRKGLRYTKYFILENKFFVTMGASIIVLVTSLVIFMNLRVYAVNYNEKDLILANTLWYTAEEAYITNEDMNGNIINKDKYYALIRVKINNTSINRVSLTRNTFRLDVNGKLLIPKFSYPEKFMDVGLTFSPTEIDSGVDKEYIVVFEIDKKDVKNEYVFRIKNYEDGTFGKIESQYKDIIVKPYNLISKNNVAKYALKNDISFSKTVLGNTSLHVSSYDVSDVFKEKYDYCVKKCYEGTYIVRAQTVGKGKLAVLKIKSTIKVDDELYMKKYLEYPKDLYKYYASIKYRYQGVTKTSNINVINVKYDLDNYSYLEVPLEVMEANKIELILSIRGIKYTIILK